VYGLLASLMSRVAERWFGGYTLGSGLVFGSLFSVFWRGSSFEFFFGTVFWSFLTMFGLFQIGKRLKILIPTPLAAGNRRASAVAVPRSLPIRKRHDPPALLPARPPADTAAT
ncbi:MAG: hypothetical protein ACR2HE_06665, partial [Casimicrobiaceae bacterium]